MSSTRTASSPKLSDYCAQQIDSVHTYAQCGGISLCPIEMVRLIPSNPIQMRRACAASMPQLLPKPALGLKRCHAPRDDGRYPRRGHGGLHRCRRCWHSRLTDALPERSVTWPSTRSAPARRFQARAAMQGGQINPKGIPALYTATWQASAKLRAAHLFRFRC